VQSPCLADNLDPGSQIQVIGIPEDDLRSDLLQLTLLDCLDTSLRTHRHEGGRFHGPVIRLQQAGSGMSVGSDNCEGHGRPPRGSNGCINKNPPCEKRRGGLQ